MRGRDSIDLLFQRGISSLLQQLRHPGRSGPYAIHIPTPQREGRREGADVGGGGSVKGERMGNELSPAPEREQTRLIFRER